MFIVGTCFQADKRAADTDKAVADVEKTHKRAKDLNSEIENLLKKIQGKKKCSMALSCCRVVVNLPVFCVDIWFTCLT